MKYIIRLILKIKFVYRFLSVQQEKHLEYLAGYILNNGQPIICYKCNSKELFQCNYYNSEYGPLEYDMKCKKCDSIVGHWAYGNWIL